MLAPGAWLTTLAASCLDLSVPTSVSAETVCYYRPRTDADHGSIDHSYKTMPVFLPDQDNGLGPFGVNHAPRASNPG